MTSTTNANQTTTAYPFMGSVAHADRVHRVLSDIDTMSIGHDYTHVLIEMSNGSSFGSDGYDMIVFDSNDTETARVSIDEMILSPMYIDVWGSDRMDEHIRIRLKDVSAIGFRIEDRDGDIQFMMWSGDDMNQRALMVLQ